MNRNLWLMVAAQALFLTNNVVFVANYVSLLLIGAIAIAVLWYAFKERVRHQAAA